MAALVQHGRRKGTPKSHDASVVSEEFTPEHSKQKAALISLNDWSRIQNKLTGVNEKRDEARKRQEKKEAKHQQSVATVKHWGNTIEGQRLQRLENRKLKAIKDEEEKLKLDEEEARFQAEARRKAIERAKTLLYYRTDRVKAFHSNLILSEVLREREQQIKRKNIRKDLLKLQEMDYLKLQDELRDKAILKDLKKAKEQTKAAQDTCQFQLQQAAKNKAQKVEDRKQQLEEQDALVKEFEKWKEIELEKEKKRQKTKQEHKKDLDRVVADRNRRDEELRNLECLEDKERSLFAEAKKNMVKKRKAKEAEIIRAVQEHQEKIKDQLQKINEKQVSNEDERIAQAVAEQDEKKQKAEKEKHDKYVKSMKDIFNHRVKMMAELQQKERERKELEQELLRQRIAQDEKFHSVQLQKQRKAALEGRDVQKFQQAQMMERLKNEELEMIEEHEDWQKNMSLVKLEEDQFQSYANKVINEAKERNGPVYPLIVAAKSGPGGGRGDVFSGKGGVRPSYQATDSTATELPSYSIDPSNLPVSWRLKNTKKRMGFTW